MSVVSSEPVSSAVTRNRFFRPVLAIVAFLAALALVVFAGSSVSVHEKVLYQASSKDAGVTYEDMGAQWASDLSLVRIFSLNGSRYELHLGPGAKDYYYPVALRFGSGEPRIRKVDWKSDGVTVTFESGDSVGVPADNFRKVR
ncbi:hypothetical protein [Amycolatopsis pigmentata]|uniref:Uncharacterized protein n=1 Tax=Amycolatopsis pigmentata TaxID=450801 RepID=A0ABW5FV39_9PSEU